MYRHSLAAGVLLCIMLVVVYQVNGSANLASELTSAFTSAVDLLRQFCSRALMSVSINVNHAVKAFTRVFAWDPLRTYRQDFINFFHKVITRLIEERTIFLEEQLRPQPPRENRSYSYEDPFYHCERQPPVSLFGDNGLPADFNRHSWHTVLLLLSSLFSALLGYYYGALCLAPWRYACGQISALPRRLAAEPTATWETVSENLMSGLLNVMSALAKLFAVASGWFLIFTKGLAFYTECFKLYAAGRFDLGFTKRLDPEVREICKFIPDPRAPILEEKCQKAEAEFENIRENFHIVCRDRALENKIFYDNEEIADNRNANQRAIIRKYATMHDEVGLTKPLYDQYVEEKRLRHVAEETTNRTVQESDATEKKLHEKIDEKDAKLRESKKAESAEKAGHAITKASYKSFQERADKNEKAYQAKIKSKDGQIRNLTSDKEANDLRVKSLEAQLKDRDEIIDSQKQTMEAMEARGKEQEQRHSSQLKSQLASHKKGSDWQVTKWAKACQQNIAQRGAAEKKLKTADEARKTADSARETAERTLKAEKDARKTSEEESAAKIKAAEEARETAERALKAEEDARKTAEAESAANLKALKAEEDARKTADEKRKAAEIALKSAVDARKAAEDESAANLTALKAEEDARKNAEEKLGAAETALKAAEEARKAAEEEAASLRERLDNITPPSPRKMPPGSPSTTPPGSPGRSPSPPPPGSPGRSPSPPPPGSPSRPPSPQPFGAPSPPRRGILPRPTGPPSQRRMARMGRPLRPRAPQSNPPPGNPGPSQPPNFQFSFTGGPTPNMPGSGPSAPPAGPSMPPAAP